MGSSSDRRDDFFQTLVKSELAVDGRFVVLRIGRVGVVAAGRDGRVDNMLLLLIIPSVDGRRVVL